jgi:hypothetical protein
VRVLLSDGSGLTSRQCATLLAREGHDVSVLAAAALPLTRWTRHVSRVHRLPPYGPDPLGWWDVAVRVLQRERPDVLLPTQEQVAVISRRQRDLDALGVGTVVPPFAALQRVQDKLAADQTLRAAGLRRPSSWVARDAAGLVRGVCGPAFLKAPIGTASTGVQRVRGRDQVRAAAAAFQQAGAFAAGGVLVEEPVAGPLLMVQSVFSAGRLLALHANERTREGAGGGASTKTSRSLPGAADDVQLLGQLLGWHGALSLDAILDKDGPVWIDVNPRLVEPFNAARSGVDLLGPLLALARGQAGPSTVVGGTPGVRTHQLLLAVLGAAQSGRGRAGVARELLSAATRSGPYTGSTEELTPVAGDPLAAVPVAAAALACLLRPSLERLFTSKAVSGYALTPQGWHDLQAA